MSGLLPGAPAADPLGGTSYAPPVPATADPAANRMDRPENWAHDYAPRRPVSVPPGCLAIQVTNGIPVSTGNCMPGDVVVIPHDEARALIRQGYAREVLAL